MLVIIRNPDQDAAEIIWQARKIGYDRLAGELRGGMGAWVAADQPTAATRLVAAGHLGQQPVLDVRQLSEFTAGHLPGAAHIELGELATGNSGRPPDEPTVIMCGHGERAAGAASLLERAGRRDLTVVTGGPDEWSRSTGQPLENGP